MGIVLSDTVLADNLDCSKAQHENCRVNLLSNASELLRPPQTFAIPAGGQTHFHHSIRDGYIQLPILESIVPYELSTQVKQTHGLQKSKHRSPEQLWSVLLIDNRLMPITSNVRS